MLGLNLIILVFLGIKMCYKIPKVLGVIRKKQQTEILILLMCKLKKIKDIVILTKIRLN